MIYIYTLSHPITNEVRYVGKTINIRRRYKQHLYDKRQKHKYAWIQSLKNEGLKPVLTIIEECETNWQEREIYWIKQFDNLINYLEGGGSDYVRVTSEETKEKIRQANLGKVLSEDHKNKIKDSSNKKKVSVNGVVYNSISEANRITKIPLITLHGRINNDSNKFKEYYYV